MGLKRNPVEMDPILLESGTMESESLVRSISLLELFQLFDLKSSIPWDWNVKIGCTR
jgi:hypothetical protein